MASDYVKEHPDYVRAVMSESMIHAPSYCHYCGSEQGLQQEGCHIRCVACGQISNGCGD